MLLETDFFFLFNYFIFFTEIWVFFPLVHRIFNSVGFLMHFKVKYTLPSFTKLGPLYLLEAVLLGGRRHS